MTRTLLNSLFDCAGVNFNNQQSVAQYIAANPDRAKTLGSIISQLEPAQRELQAQQQAAQEAHNRYRAKAVEQWNSEFDSWLPANERTGPAREALGAGLAELFRTVGLSKSDVIAYVRDGLPIDISHSNVQKIMYYAAKYLNLQKSLHEARPAPKPQPMRPGVGRDSHSEDDAAAEARAALRSASASGKSSREQLKLGVQALQAARRLARR